ncbi:hypothetical protein AVV48_gp30 [Acinetobacter phage phiAC-1]|nr:hypothetical protein AVV48_gp30 [Acinetobacter phage phiAC-1]AFU62279.1 hypothetical protein phiAC-1_0030 [Acinetobacter phage phiAC-1]
MSNFIIGFFVSFVFTWFICSNYTHSMIAAECERLGGFFVGKKYISAYP